MRVKGFYRISTSREGAASDGPLLTGSAPERVDESTSAPFMSASHERLFEAHEATRCDACQSPLPLAGEATAYGVEGRGVYVWQRGGEARHEAAPLCPACASAIGMTALARWEIEEEEG